MSVKKTAAETAAAKRAAANSEYLRKMSLIQREAENVQTPTKGKRTKDHPYNPIPAGMSSDQYFASYARSFALELFRDLVEFIDSNGQRNVDSIKRASLKVHHCCRDFELRSNMFAVATPRVTVAKAKIVKATK